MTKVRSGAYNESMQTTTATTTALQAFGSADDGTFAQGEFATARTAQGTFCGTCTHAANNGDGSFTFTLNLLGGGTQTFTAAGR